MNSPLRLALLTFVALSLSGCRSPTDTDPTPPAEEEEEEPKESSFLSFDGAPILV
jgi:hypothetical protein